jgi:hypothetical protein
MSMFVDNRDEICNFLTPLQAGPPIQATLRHGAGDVRIENVERKAATPGRVGPGCCPSLDYRARSTGSGWSKR